MKLTAAAALCGTCAVAEHPIERIVGLLKGLAQDCENEGKTEAVSYEKFEYWCKNSVKTLNKAIAEENENIDSLASKIDAKTKERDALAKQIGKLTDQLSELSTANTKAETQRNTANGLYETARDDMQATVTAMESCITALEDAKDDTSLVQAKKKVSGVMALVQTSLSEDQTATLKSFTDPADVMAMGDNQAHVKKYSFKGGNVIELLKQLKLKFEDDLLAIEKEETQSVNSYNLAKKARDNAIDAATDSKSEKETIKGEVESELGEAQSDKSDEEDELNADTGTLETTKKSCSVKASEWQERSEIRTNEIAAINQAIKILAKVGGVRTEAPSNPIPPASPVTFLQMSATSNDPKMKAVVYLRQQAKVLHAKALNRLAQELSTHLGDPFAEVTNMIEKMIFRLMAEQKDEDDHKNWCDKELAKTAASIDNKEDKIAELTAKIDDADATVNDLTEEIKDANEMVADIVGFMKEATEIREIGKKENKLAIKDAEDAQTAVSNAIAVLTDFYKSSGQVAKEDWEFVQTHRGVDLPENPDTWGSSYTGVADPAAQPGGIITVLETTNSDFAQMEADTRAQEASDQEAYDNDMQSHDIEKAKRSKESEMKSNEKKRLVEKVTSLTKTKKHVSDELEATEQYNTDLRPACVDGDSTYEDRKAARTSEIDALHNAQNILAEAFKESSSFLQRKPIRRA